MKKKLLIIIITTFLCATTFMLFFIGRLNEKDANTSSNMEATLKAHSSEEVKHETGNEGNISNKVTQDNLCVDYEAELQAEEMNEDFIYESFNVNESNLLSVGHSDITTAQTVSEEGNMKDPDEAEWDLAD